MSGVLISEISVIVPVKDNQKGVSDLLESFFNTQKKETYPKEIILVDNRSKKPLYLDPTFRQTAIDIRIISCSKKGPAAARNLGAASAQGEWLFFTDSDCLFTPTTLTGYKELTSETVAFAGKVIPSQKNRISNYYASIHLLNPPIEKGSGEPEYIVTANTLIRQSAFQKVQGFDEKFILASGEDVDLGWRLKKVGKITLAENSVVLHQYENNLRSFYKRFVKYGKGISQLEKKHDLKIDIHSILPEIPKKMDQKLLRYLLKKAILKGKKSVSIKHRD